MDDGLKCGILPYRREECCRTGRGRRRQPRAGPCWTWDSDIQGIWNQRITERLFSTTESRDVGGIVQLWWKVSRTPAEHQMIYCHISRRFRVQNHDTKQVLLVLRWALLGNTTQSHDSHSFPTPHQGWYKRRAQHCFDLTKVKLHPVGSQKTDYIVIFFTSLRCHDHSARTGGRAFKVRGERTGFTTGNYMAFPELSNSRGPRSLYLE